MRPGAPLNQLGVPGVVSHPGVGQPRTQETEESSRSSNVEPPRHCVLPTSPVSVLIDGQGRKQIKVLDARYQTVAIQWTRQVPGRMMKATQDLRYRIAGAP